MSVLVLRSNNHSQLRTKLYHQGDNTIDILDCVVQSDGWRESRPDRSSRDKNRFEEVL
jgi:hypothetical protein